MNNRKILTFTSTNRNFLNLKTPNMKLVNHSFHIHFQGEILNQARVFFRLKGNHMLLFIGQLNKGQTFKRWNARCVQIYFWELWKLMIKWTGGRFDWLNDWLGFYALTAIFRAYNDAKMEVNVGDKIEVVICRVLYVVYFWSLLGISPIKNLIIMSSS